MLDESVLKIEGVATSISMGKIREADSRLVDLAIVNPANANEFCSVLASAMNYITDTIPKLELEYIDYDAKARELSSEIVLDKAKDILKVKGLETARSPAGSADLRQAILDGDTDYQNALVQTQKIKVVIQFLKDKNTLYNKVFYKASQLLDKRVFQGAGTLNGTDKRSVFVNGELEDSSMFGST